MFQKILDYFGGREYLAEICGVSERATYYWQDIGRIPLKNAIVIERESAGKFKAEKLVIGWD